MHPLKELAQRYPDKRVLITGATSGLGEALVLQFADAGFRVGVAGRNPERIRATTAKVEAAGAEALPVQLEVTEVSDFEGAVQTVGQSWGGLDILINNAGMPAASKIAETSPDIWHHVLNTNLWSVIHGCRLFVPMLQRGNGGHIVNVSSTAGLICAPGMSTYNVSKAGVIALSETLAAELAEDGINVTVCCPTLFKSGIFDNVDTNSDNELFYGTAAAGLQSQMTSTGVTSDDVATRLIEAMARRRLYSVPMRDGRIAWRILRYCPETFRKIMLQMYRRQVWVFKSEPGSTPRETNR